MKHKKDNDNLKLFSLSASKKLGDLVAEKLGIDLVDAEVSRFADGEVQINIKESIRNDNAYIIQSTSTPVNDNIMELLIFVDALKRASAKEINVIMPYYGYSRQERKTKSRQPISAKLVANLIERAGVDRVIMLELHAPQIQGFFDIPTDHLTSGIEIGKFLKDKYQSFEDIVIVSPDFGGLRRARKLAKELGSKIAVVDKRRPSPGVAEVRTIIGDNLVGKTAILLDDIIDTGGTLCASAEAVKEQGASEVSAICTHGILSSDAQEKIENSSLTKLYITNSTEHTSITTNKIERIDISTIIAQAIEMSYKGQSIGDLFGGN